MPGQSQSSAAGRHHAEESNALLRRYRRAWRNLHSRWVLWEVLLLLGLAGAIALWTILPDGNLTQSTATITVGLLILVGACWFQSLILIRARRRQPLHSPARGALLLFVLLLLWLAVNSGLGWIVQKAIPTHDGSPAAAFAWWLPRLLTGVLLLPFALEGAGRAVHSPWIQSPARTLQLLDYWLASLLPAALNAVVTELLFAWRPAGDPRYLFALGIGKMFLIAAFDVCCICLEISVTSTFLRDQESRNDAVVSSRSR